MDFALSDEQRALSELAAQILGDQYSLERAKVIESSEDRYDFKLWAELAKAGLLGAALPASAGGSEGGFLEACLLLEQIGRRAALLPILDSVVATAMPIARFGTEEQKQRYLPGVVGGESLLTAALSELDTDSRAPRCRAVKSSDGWLLSGVKTGVPMAHRAASVLVPACTEDGAILLCLIDPKAPGVGLAAQDTMNWEAHFRIQLQDVPVTADAVLGSTDDGVQILNWIVDRVTVGLCALATGACSEALRITAEHASNRKQFDKPIAMFQAVGQRMADSFIDNQAVNLTMWQAASRLADEVPSDMEVATAKFWACDAAHRIGHAALHIHGGISIDIDYPIHRYFQWLKQIEGTLGAATPQLVRLGELIAAD